MTGPGPDGPPDPARRDSVGGPLAPIGRFGRLPWLAAAMRRLRTLRPGQARPPRTAANSRIYAIGDVHGRIDLLRDLLGRIEQDNAGRPRRRVVTLLVGDFIDRGPGAAALLSALARERPAGLLCLLGNHEAAMIDAYDGDYQALEMWLAHGGRETLAGFGADPVAVDAAHGRALLALVRAHVPAACIDWLRTLPLRHVDGDYLFVHAGIRPGCPLRRQHRHDLLWIREPFLSDPRRHPKIVVHGHSPTRNVDARHNRIGIDTGAFATGRLTALGLQDTEQWVVQVDGARE